MTRDLVKQHLDTLLAFFEQNYRLVNCHTVDYFTRNLYQSCIPLLIKNEVSACGFTKITSQILENSVSEHTPNLLSFINKCKSYSLYNSSVCITHKDFQDTLVQLTKNETYRNTIKLKVFVTDKKSHEIERMSNICAALNDYAKTSHLVDLGDGKGYLSSILALNYKIKVLGVEGLEIKTDGAIKRVEKLKRVWHSLPKNPNKSVLSSEDRNKIITDDTMYKQVTKFVTEDTDVKELVANVYLEGVENIGLIGLHTCGNLTPTSLKMYAFNDSLKTFCNVGCCYHLMNEYFEDENFNANTSNAFPISEYLKSKKCALGRQARMLAAQTIDRILNDKILPTKTTFFRAILQILLSEHFGKDIKDKNIGRLKKECATFVDYAKVASNRLKVDFKKSDEDLLHLFEAYSDKLDELNVFYLIRSMLAPTIESIILLDRLLFLLESGYSNSYLVHLFDPVISPRCYAIVSYK